MNCEDEAVLMMNDDVDLVRAEQAERDDIGWLRRIWWGLFLVVLWPVMYTALDTGMWRYSGMVVKVLSYVVLGVYACGLVYCMGWGIKRGKFLGKYDVLLRRGLVVGIVGLGLVTIAELILKPSDVKGSDTAWLWYYLNVIGKWFFKCVVQVCLFGLFLGLAKKFGWRKIWRVMAWGLGIEITGRIVHLGVAHYTRLIENPGRASEVLYTLSDVFMWMNLVWVFVIICYLLEVSGVLFRLRMVRDAGDEDGCATGSLPIDLMCIGCGYNLRGTLETGACPECGDGVKRSLSEENFLFSGVRRRVVIGLWVLFVLPFCWMFGSNNAMRFSPHPYEKMSDSLTEHRVTDAYQLYLDGMDFWIGLLGIVFVLCFGWFCCRGKKLRGLRLDGIWRRLIWVLCAGYLGVSLYGYFVLGNVGGHVYFEQREDTGLLRFVIEFGVLTCVLGLLNNYARRVEAVWLRRLGLFLWGLAILLMGVGSVSFVACMMGDQAARTASFGIARQRIELNNTVTELFQIIRGASWYLVSGMAVILIFKVQKSIWRGGVYREILERDVEEVCDDDGK